MNRNRKHKINSMKEFREALRNGAYEFVVHLQHGLQSTKFYFLIRSKIWIESSSTFDSWEANASDLNYIREAIDAGAFYVEPY